MKTNKLWSIIMMLVLVLGSTISFSSCGDDDDGITSVSTNSIVGTWVYFEKDGSYSFSEMVTFKTMEHSK